MFIVYRVGSVSQIVNSEAIRLLKRLIIYVWAFLVMRDADAYAMYDMPKWIIGIDEAGRGPLAGPLSFGAVAMRADALAVLEGIKDSKKLTERAREKWHEDLTGAEGVVTLYGDISVKKIDEFRMGKVIAVGSRALARRMLETLGVSEDEALFLLDGSLEAPRGFRQMSIIDGDAQVDIIAAASVVAKVRRDRAMRTLHCKYPEYGFNRHKGYGTKGHRDAIRQYGPTPVHRRSFTLL